MWIVNAREVLRKAWSVRLLAALIALELVGVVLSVRGAFVDNQGLAMAFQLAGAVLGIGAFVARLLYQQGLSRG